MRWCDASTAWTPVDIVDHLGTERCPDSNRWRLQRRLRLPKSERFWKILKALKGHQRISKVPLRNLGAALVQNQLAMLKFVLWPFVAQWSRTCARQLPVVELELAALRLEADNSLARRSEISLLHVPQHPNFCKSRKLTCRERQPWCNALHPFLSSLARSRKTWDTLRHFKYLKTKHKRQPCLSGLWWTSLAASSQKITHCYIRQLALYLTALPCGSMEFKGQRQQSRNNANIPMCPTPVSGKPCHQSLLKHLAWPVF